MLVVALTVGLLALLMAAMALGLLRGRRLRGSCGGSDSADCHCAANGVPEDRRPCLQPPKLSTLRVPDRHA